MNRKHVTEQGKVERAVRDRMAQEASASAKGLAFLSEAGRILSSSLDYETTLRSVARLTVPTVADFCLVDLIEDTGEIRRVATAHHDPEKEALAAELRRFPPDPRLSSGVPAVLRTGEPEVINEVDDAALEQATRGPEHLRIGQQLGPSSWLIVPLMARGHVLGAITLVCTDSERRYGADDLALAEELASRAALAIDNARLYRDAQTELAERQKAREELDQKAGFLQLLLDITTAANEAASFEGALQVALERVRIHTGWPIGHVFQCAPDGNLVSTTLWSTDDPERFQVLREVTTSLTFAPGSGLPGRVLATGKAVAISDVDADPSFLRARSAADLGVKAAFAFPVMIGPEVMAVLEFFSGRSTEPDASFLEVMEHVGTQLGRVVERQLAEEALRESEQRFRQIAENVGEVFWISDAELTRIIYVSPMFDAIWGRPREQLYQSPRVWMEAIHPEDRAQVDESIWQRTRGTYEIQYRIVRPDGEVRWIYDRGFPVEDATGEVYRVVGIAEDITEDKQVELERNRLLAREQAAREEAESAVHARDEVMRMVSHDLRNPLHTINLAASLLADVPLSEEQRAEQVAVIQRTADHMQRLVQGLLDLKRIEVGQGIPVEPKRTDVVSLLEKGCALFRPQAESKGLELRREAPSSSLSVRADAERVLQVLWNLTGNAIKFTAEGGEVVIRSAEREDDVLISVTDTGPGIAPEDLDRLFDPFWQAKRTARLGTGLGLPISKAIVEAHGGRIWVESEPGAGTTFFFTLPKE